MTDSTWSRARIDSLIDGLTAGVSVRSNASSNSRPAVLKTSAIGAGRFNPREAKSIVADEVGRAKCTPRHDSIIVSRMNTPALVGEIGYVAHDEPDLFLPDRLWLAGSRADVEVDMQWLAFVLSSEEGSRRIRELATGTSGSMKNIPKSKLLALEIATPPYAEQKLIAIALADAASLLTSLETLIVKKQAIKQGMMQQLLTGETRLPGFTEPWPVMTLGTVGNVKTGPFGSALHESDYVLDGTPIITVEHLAERGVQGAGAPMVSDSDRRRLRAYTLRAGDIVFSRVGSIDRNARVTEAEAGWLFSGRLLRVRFDPAAVDTRFMSAQFHSPKFTDAVRAVAVGQTMPSLNTAILKGVQILFPSLSEQQAIGAVVEALDQELDALEHRAKSARDVKQGMMQELLTGRTRLTNAESTT